MAIVFLITNGVTGFAVLHMRKTIKGMKNIYVKETLVIFHLINFAPVAFQGVEELLDVLVDVNDLVSEEHHDPP